jgi:pilus assembly protein CpaE
MMNRPRVDETLTLATLVRSAETGRLLETALTGCAGFALRPLSSRPVDLPALRALGGDLALLDIDEGAPAEMRALADFIRDEGATPLIVTSARLDVRLMRELMHIGVPDVLPQPFAAEDLEAAAMRAMSRRRPGEAQAERVNGKILSFLKSGGGVGATSLAMHGALAVARGRNGLSPALLDLDLQFGMAALMADVEQRGSILDLAPTPARIDAALLRGAMVRVHGRVDLLAAPGQVSPLDGVSAEGVATTLATAQREYALTLVDLPLAWTDWVHATLALSDGIALVLRLTVPSLRQARRQLAILREEGLDGVPLTVVANAVEKSLFGTKGLSLKEAERALGRPIDYVVPLCPALTTAGDAGQPLSAVRGGHALEKLLGTLILGMLRKAEPVKARSAPGKA